MNSVPMMQRTANLRTRDRWLQYRSHRIRVTDAIAACALSDGARLCVLGAGNCNDLDLRSLARIYREIVLVDLDGDALQAGVERQAMNGSVAMRTRGGVDLTGALDELGSLSSIQDGSAIERCLIRLRKELDPGLPGPFDVVASTCVLTQLIGSVVGILGRNHQQLYDFVFAVRDSHLRLLWGLVKPGGVGLLVTDFVSSFTCPDLRKVDEKQFRMLASHVIGVGNFFTGVNPLALYLHLIDCNGPGCARARVRLMEPWRWDTGDAVYAVAAVRFDRADLG
jgi:hypothetical protein